MLAVNSSPGLITLNCLDVLQLKQRVMYLKCFILLIHYILPIFNSIAS